MICQARIYITGDICYSAQFKGGIFMYIYGSKLKDMRIKEGMTQSEYAQRLGMEQPNYQRLERGTLDIKISMLINICTTFEVSADWLLGLTE